MRIQSFTLGSLATHCYIVAGQESAIAPAIAIDAGQNPDPMLDYLEQNRLTLTHILITHLHADHICGVRELAAGTQAQVLASSLDAYLQNLDIGRGNGLGYPAVPPFSFEPLEPGRIELLGQPLLVLDTPGHSQGSLSFFFPRAGAVFVGDVLFQGSVGRTDVPGGDSPKLLRSIRERLFILPNSTRVFPGHGQDTSIGREKAENLFFQPPR